MFDLKRPEGIGISSYVLRDAQLVRLAWMVPLFSILTAIGIHVFLGNTRDVPFFISEADYPGLGRIVFTSGLFASAVLHCLLSLRLYSIFKESARPKMFLFATGMGITSSTHLAILSFANMYDFLSLHVYASLVVFHGAFTWAILAHFSLPNPNKKGRKLRLISLAMAFVSLSIMTISMSKGVQQRRSELDVQPDMIPLNDLQPWIDVAAPAEYILFFSLLGCLASFSWDILEHTNQHEDSSIKT